VTWSPGTRNDQTIRLSATELSFSKTSHVGLNKKRSNTLTHNIIIILPVSPYQSSSFTVKQSIFLFIFTFLLSALITPPRSFLLTKFHYCVTQNFLHNNCALSSLNSVGRKMFCH